MSSNGAIGDVVELVDTAVVGLVAEEESLLRVLYKVREAATMQVRILPSPSAACRAALIGPYSMVG